jgi:hypothetical protein
MESLKQDDDRPTTSTIGVSPDGLDTDNLPVQNRDTLDDTKPSVTISPDAITDKEPAPKIATPPLAPLNEDDDQEHITMSTDNEQERERELRQSIQIQAPFPPTSDESQTDARVISPAPQISLQQTTESEDSDEEEEVPEVIRTIVDEPQPRVSP